MSLTINVGRANHQLKLVLIFCLSIFSTQVRANANLKTSSCELAFNGDEPFAERQDFHVNIARTQEALSFSFKRNYLNLTLGSSHLGVDIGASVVIPGSSQPFHASGGAATTHSLKLGEMKLKSKKRISEQETRYIYKGYSDETFFTRPLAFRVEVVLNEVKDFVSLKVFEKQRIFLISRWKLRNSYSIEDLKNVGSFRVPRIALSEQTSNALFRALYWDLDVPEYEFAPYFKYRDGLYVGDYESFIAQDTSPAEIFDAINGIAAISPTAGQQLAEELFNKYKFLMQQNTLPLGKSLDNQQVD